MVSFSSPPYGLSASSRPVSKRPGLEVLKDERLLLVSLSRVARSFPSAEPTQEREKEAVNHPEP